MNHRISVDDGERKKRKDKEVGNRKPPVRKWYRGMTAVTQLVRKGKLGLQITVRYWRVYYRSQRGIGGSTTDH